MKLVLFSQNGCNPCVAVKNFLNSEEVEFEAINLSEKENEEKGKEFGIMSTPVTLLIDEDGEEVAKVVGFNELGLEVLISQL